VGSEMCIRDRFYIVLSESALMDDLGIIV
jgi:hypothetical protein